MKHRRESGKDPADDEANFDLVDDPFNQKPKGGESELSRRIGDARLEGRLNIAALGLKEVPSDVLKMYELTSADVAWGEFVDLTRFTAADNEIEVLPDDMFPDEDGDDDKTAQFAGLMTIDLHGNLLTGVPLGFRKLEMLTVLNLVRCPNLRRNLADILASLATSSWLNP